MTIACARPACVAASRTDALAKMLVSSRASLEGSLSKLLPPVIPERISEAIADGISVLTGGKNKAVGTLISGVGDEEAKEEVDVGIEAKEEVEENPGGNEADTSERVLTGERPVDGRVARDAECEEKEA